MTTKLPPRIAAWILNRVTGDNDPLVGDLVEQYAEGRSRAWFWRQVIDAAFVHIPRPLMLVGLVFMLYLAGTFVAIPGARDVLQSLMSQRASGPPPSELFTVFLLGGGQMAWGTIFTLGINPYISAACLVVIAQMLWSTMNRHRPHRRRLPVMRLTWALALFLCVWQAMGFALFLERASAGATEPIVAHPGMMFRMTALVMMTAGTACLMLISDQISRRQMGNGMLIVFLAGMVAAIPRIAGPLMSGAFDGFTITVILAINTGIAALIAFGYQRAIAREAVA